jgi:aminoglycoside phosphotransferase (APT) family kinase protein
MGNDELIDRVALAAFIRRSSGASEATVEDVERLRGGAIQFNLALDVRIDGVLQRLVLRSDAPSGVEVSRPRDQEFALLRAAFAAGVPVAEPLWYCDDPAVFGRPFFLMRFVEGTAAAHRIVKDETLGGNRHTLAGRIGEALARIHAIPQTPGLHFLNQPARSPALDFVDQSRAYLDANAFARPALEWGLRWLELNAPPAAAPVLVHRDFRTGNIMLDEHGIAAVMDWEFAAIGDAHEDLGWFCAKCWRFGRDDREAGGIGDREDFYRGYEAGGGGRIDDARVRYWEALAHARWAVIALQQAQRHSSGAERSLELALTGTIVPGLERELLRMTAPKAARV